ncbi:MAG: hypothetical protein AB7S26_13340 [Sandaracinaceae bacterium]
MCTPTGRARPIGPLQLGYEDGLLGVARRACARREITLGGDLLLVADGDALYGNIRINGRLAASTPLLSDDVETFVSWEPVRYQTLISAVSASYLGLGYLSFGATGRVYHTDDVAIGVTSRFVAPTTSGLDQGNYPLSLDLGATAQVQADPNLGFHFYLLVLGSLMVGGPPLPRGGVRAGAGLDWSPIEWLAFVLEAASQLGYRDAVDHIAASAGVRLALGDVVGIELGVSMPFYGQRAFDDGALPILANLTVSLHLE